MQEIESYQDNTKIEVKKRNMADEVKYSFTLKNNDIAIGWATTIIHKSCKDIAEILCIRVAEENKGNGTKLYHSIESVLKSKGIKKAVLLESNNCGTSPEKSSYFWNKLGFQKTKRSDIGRHGDYDRIKQLC